jgi:hypothetical protein
MEDLVIDGILGWARGTYGGENKYIKRNDVDPQGNRPHGRPSSRQKDINYAVKG